MELQLAEEISALLFDGPILKYASQLIGELHARFSPQIPIKYPGFNFPEGMQSANKENFDLEKIFKVHTRKHYYHVDGMFTLFLLNSFFSHLALFARSHFLTLLSPPLPSFSPSASYHSLLFPVLFFSFRHPLCWLP